MIQKTNWPRNSGIQDPVSKIANTLSFDMPGTGKSVITNLDISSMEPTSLLSVAVMIDRLAKFHKMPSPCILVAHSIGGMIARVYQNIYPVTAGMVLIDPTPDFIIQNLPPPGDYSNLSPEVRLRKTIIENYMIGYRLNMSRDVTPIENNNRDQEHTIVHYNIDDSRSDKVQFEDYILKRFKNVVRHDNRAHHIHILEPASIIRSITEIVEKCTNGSRDTRYII